PHDLEVSRSERIDDRERLRRPDEAVDPIEIDEIAGRSLGRRSSAAYDVLDLCPDIRGQHDATSGPLITRALNREGPVAAPRLDETPRPKEPPAVARHD